VVKTGYCVRRKASFDLPNSAHVTVDVTYLETNKPVVRGQLQKAVVRLARILDAGSETDLRNRPASKSVAGIFVLKPGPEFPAYGLPFGGRVH
jgi:hypothetical protein